MNQTAQSFYEIGEPYAAVCSKSRKEVIFTDVVLGMPDILSILRRQAMKREKDCTFVGINLGGQMP